MVNMENERTPEFDKCFGKESQLTTGKSETKQLIEKLIMQETFSRKERDSLMSIIDSRVIDGSSIPEGLVKRSDITDLCAKAITEAKQWLEEKKETSNSKIQLSHGISPLNSVTPSKDINGGLGSPVDIAKSYMRGRPPWSSLSLNSAGEKTPLTVGREFLKDEAPYGCSFSSSKLKLSSGSWNIQDELRRVRSKATEDMLKTLPSQKNKLSSLALEPEGIESTLLNGRIELDQRDGLQDSNMFSSVKLIDESSNLRAAVASDSTGLPASAADTTQDNVQTEDLQPVTLAQIQGVENIQMVEEDKLVADGSRDLAIPKSVLDNDLRFSDKSCPAADGDIPLNPNAVCSSHDKLAGVNSLEETCELLSETLVEIPGMDKIDDVAIGNSLSNSIKPTDKSSKNLTRPKNPKQGGKGKSAKVGKGQGRNLRPRERTS